MLKKYPNFNIMDKVNNVKYSVEFQSFMRTMVASNFDCDKTIRRKINALNASGMKSLPFTLVANLENTEIVDGKIKATFLIPWGANLSHVLYFDPKIQKDFSGKMALGINCVLRKIKPVE